MSSSDATKKTRVFITGATGYIGGVITEYCIKEGYEVHGLSRNEKGDDKLKALGAIPIRGDLTTLDILRKESSQADIIFQLAWVMDFQNTEKVLRIDAAAVDAMCEPLTGTGKAFIMTSGTLVVAPNPDHKETTEDSPHGKISLVARIRSEEHALQNWAKKGIRVICLRLAPFVYGRGGSGFLTFMMQMAVKNRESIYIGDGSACVTTGHVDDIAQLYLLAAKSNKTGEVFNATTDTTVTFRHMAESIGDLLKLPVRSVTQDEASNLWNPFFAMIFCIENRASSRKAQDLMGWRPSCIGILSDIRSGSYVEAAKRLEAGENLDRF